MNNEPKDSANNRSAAPGISFSPQGLCSPGGRALRLCVRECTQRRHYRSSPCARCALGFLHERPGATGTPSDCRPWVRCMAHERPDRRSVYFVEAEAGGMRENE